MRNRRVTYAAMPGDGLYGTIPPRRADTVVRAARLRRQRAEDEARLRSINDANKKFWVR